MTRPRLLLVPLLTELEWTIRPQLEEWAEVASYDAPGVGTQPPAKTFNYDTLAETGLDELDARGWESCVVVSDGFQNSVALRLARTHPDAIDAVALGHARLSNDSGGTRPPINGEVVAAFGQLLKTNYEGFVRHGLVQVTHGSYGDEIAEQMPVPPLRRSPQPSRSPAAACKRKEPS